MELQDTNRSTVSKTQLAIGILMLVVGAVILARAVFQHDGFFAYAVGAWFIVMGAMRLRGKST